MLGFKTKRTFSKGRNIYGARHRGFYLLYWYLHFHAAVYKFGWNARFAFPFIFRAISIFFMNESRNPY